MLKKLLKYDLKWTYKALLIFYILMFIFAIASRLLSFIDHSMVFSILEKICSGTAVAMMISIVINNVMRCWARLVRNVYKEEAYLTHTLPVSKTHIFLSKIGSAFITLLTSSIVIGLGLYICYYSKENIQFLKESFTPISSLLNINITTFMILFFILIFIELFYMIISGYLGIILGHQSNNNKIIKSVVYGFAIYQIVSISSLLFLFIIGIFSKEIMNLFNTTFLPSPSLVKGVCIGQATLYIVYILLYIWIGNKILKKGVNIE